MKAATCLCPVLTLLFVTQIISAAQRGRYNGYPLDDMNSQMLPRDYFPLKRNKPSLSIVNPLDVLRQRLLLEIARRQMKENTRQVELNRAILKNVGKRKDNKSESPLIAALYNTHEREQQIQEDTMQHSEPYEYEFIPTTLIFDYLQQLLQQRQPQQQQHSLWPYESIAIQVDNNYNNDGLSTPDNSKDDEDWRGMQNSEQDIMAFNRVLGNKDKHTIKQSNNKHTTSTNEQAERKAAATTFLKSINNRNDATKRLTLINKHQLHHHRQNNFNTDLSDANPISSNPNANDFKNDNNDDVDVGVGSGGGDYQVQRYLYHLHKNPTNVTKK